MLQPVSGNRCFLHLVLPLYVDFGNDVASTGSRLQRGFGVILELWKNEFVHSSATTGRGLDHQCYRSPASIKWKETSSILENSHGLPGPVYAYALQLYPHCPTSLTPRS